MGEKRLKVGDCCCDLKSHLESVLLDNECPIKNINLSAICEFTDNDYPALKCKYKGECCYKHEVDEDDARDWPELFEGGMT